MDGPVVKAAQKALADGKINLVLIWVQPDDEAAIKTAFQKTLAVRKLSPEAKELADMYFFETLVRIHRAGEGAPYTGLKPAGRDLGPIIPAADKAIADGKVDPLLKLLPAAAHGGVQKHFKKVLTRKHFKVDDVPAGRAYVEAYVTFMHAVEDVSGSQFRACYYLNGSEIYTEQSIWVPSGALEHGVSATPGGGTTWPKTIGEWDDYSCQVGNP